MSEKALEKKEGENSEKELDKNKIGFLAILLITINSIMGTGIFFLPAIGAREAGLFSIISWVIMGIIAIYFGMIFAELVGIFPKEGGVYEYSKMAFGSFPSFILGWMTLIAANVTIAMLVVGAIMYLGPLLPQSALIGISIFFIIIFNFMAFKGLKTGVVMLVAFAIITLIAVFALLIPGLINFNVANFTGWLQHPNFMSMPNSFMGFIGGFGIIFMTIFFIAETFFGWETSTFLAEKVKNPKKNMPKAMIIATIFIAVSCVLFVIASLSLINWSAFGNSVAPLADLAAVVYGANIVPYYSLLVYLAIIGSVAGWIVAAPNLIVALAKDKMFIPQLSKIHPKTKTPYKAIIFQTIFTSLLVVVGAGKYEVLLHFLVPLLLLLYASVVISLLVIRKKYPNIERPYKAPFGNVGPIILIFITIALIVVWAATSPNAMQTLGIIFSFILFGIPIFLMLYFYYDLDATVKFQNQTAVFSFFLEKMFFPKKIRDEFIGHALIEEKVVVELGACSGLLSKSISGKKPSKHIIVEQSPALHKLIKKRLGKKDNLVVLQDEHLTSRVHPSINFADEVFSFGILSNLRDEVSYLKSIARIMPEHGRIHFFEYVDLYKVIPDKEIMDDMDKLKKVFREAGFAVRAVKRKGLFWNYLLINGIKTSNPDAVYV